MKYHPLNLGIARVTGGAQKKSSKNKKPKAQIQSQAAPVLDAEVRQKIYERDQYTCQCCGFKADKYQEIHFINHDLSDFHTENLITVCIFCHQCFRLEETSKMRSGVLVWLPEISQADLHHIARAIYVARISQGTMAESARQALDVIMTRRATVQERLSTDDPFILSMVMEDFLTAQQYALREKKLEGVRLFPLDRRIVKEGELEFNQFPQILAYWRSKDGPFGGKIPSQWKDLYAQVLSKKVA